MIIFDLDGTLANCEHRKYLVDASYREDCYYHYPATLSQAEGYFYKRDFPSPKPSKFVPDYKLFNEQCDKDTPNQAVITTFERLNDSEFTEIWSGRCESVREKTLKWIASNVYHENESLEHINRHLKMRPVGDFTPDEELKERWLDEAISKGETIDFVFDDRPKVVNMWRSRGIFVFDCYQYSREF